MENLLEIVRKSMQKHLLPFGLSFLLKGAQL